MRKLENSDSTSVRLPKFPRKSPERQATLINVRGMAVDEADDYWRRIGRLWRFIAEIDCELTEYCK